MAEALTSKDKRRRLAPEARRALLVQSAARLTLEQGYLPVPLERLGQSACASKALVYAYFPTQHDLFNAVLARQFENLVAAGIDTASEAVGLEAAALGCALIYFEHVAHVGPLIHIILRDRYMVGHLSVENRALRDRVARRLASAARRELLLRAKEAVAAINLILTIPEEAGRLVHAGEMEHERARELCAQLVRSSVKALAPSTGG
jgi:AcrR family transcriptional regulator